MHATHGDAVKLSANTQHILTFAEPTQDNRDPFVIIRGDHVKKL